MNIFHVIISKITVATTYELLSHTNKIFKKLDRRYYLILVNCGRQTDNMVEKAKEKQRR